MKPEVKPRKSAEGNDLTPHEWCRKAALDRLNTDWGLSKSERLLFWHFVRAQYLFTQGFQLLADRNLLGEQWKKIRRWLDEKGTPNRERNASQGHANRSAKSLRWLHESRQYSGQWVALDGD